jgi:hypothetical protein
VLANPDHLLLPSTPTRGPACTAVITGARGRVRVRRRWFTRRRCTRRARRGAALMTRLRCRCRLSVPVPAPPRATAMLSLSGAARGRTRTGAAGVGAAYVSGGRGAIGGGCLCLTARIDVLYGMMMIRPPRRRRAGVAGSGRCPVSTGNGKIE